MVDTGSQQSYEYSRKASQIENMPGNTRKFLTAVALVLAPLTAWAGAVRMTAPFIVLVAAWTLSAAFLAPAVLMPAHCEEQITPIMVAAGSLPCFSAPMALGLLLADRESGAADNASVLLLALGVEMALLEAAPSELLGVPLSVWCWPSLLAFAVYVVVLCWTTVTYMLPWSEALMACWLSCVAMLVVAMAAAKREQLDRKSYEAVMRFEKQLTTGIARPKPRVAMGLSQRLSAYVSRRTLCSAPNTETHSSTRSSLILGVCSLRALPSHLASPAFASRSPAFASHVSCPPCAT